VQPRYWYNPLIKSKYSVVPGLLAVVLMLVPSMLTAIGVVREKELGSIANFYSSPMTKLEFLWEKQIPYIVITAITFIILLGVIKFLFEIPSRAVSPPSFPGRCSILLSAPVWGCSYRPSPGPRSRPCLPPLLLP